MFDIEALSQSLATPRDLIRWGMSRFRAARLHYGHGTDNALDEAAYLVLHALHLPPDLPDAYLDATVLIDERRTALDLLVRRMEERKPAAYLTGEAWFAGLPYAVDERVIIPRSPLAELIQERFEPWLGGREPGRILDLCTGCGCIAIACALEFPGCRVDAVDVSPAAVEIAAKNARRHGVTDRLNLYEADLYTALSGRRYDLIVSNPPYVSAQEMARLPDEYRHEPSLAFAGGEDGLDVVLRILEGAFEHLSPNGLLVCEVGAGAQRLEARFPELPFTWLEFERGGEGVFLLTAADLEECSGAPTAVAG